MRVNIDCERKEIEEFCLEAFCHVEKLSTYVRDPDSGMPGITLIFYDKTGRILTYLSFEQCVQLRDKLASSIPPSFG